MKIILIILNLFLINTVFAEGPRSNRIPTKKYNLEALDSNLDFSHLDSKFNVIDKRKYYKVSKTLPATRERDLRFEDSALTNAVKSWDHLEKDLLYLRAKKMSLTYLLKKYPALKENSLRDLHSFIGER